MSRTCVHDKYWPADFFPRMYACRNSFQHLNHHRAAIPSTVPSPKMHVFRLLLLQSGVQLHRQLLLVANHKQRQIFLNCWAGTNNRRESHCSTGLGLLYGHERHGVASLSVANQTSGGLAHITHRCLIQIQPKDRQWPRFTNLKSAPLPKYFCLKEHIAGAKNSPKNLTQKRSLHPKLNAGSWPRGPKNLPGK